MQNYSRKDFESGDVCHESVVDKWYMSEGRENGASVLSNFIFRQSTSPKGNGTVCEAFLFPKGMRTSEGAHTC